MEFIIENHRIYAKDNDGELLAEITFPMERDGVVVVNHTYVNPILRGQGVAGKLMEELVKKLIDDNLKAIPTCSYAIGWFEKHTEYDYLLE